MNGVHELSLYLIIRALLFFILQLSLGYWVASLLVKSKKLLLLHAFAFVSVLSFLLFFIFLRYPQTGSLLSSIFVLLGAVSLVPNALSLAKNRSIAVNFLLFPLFLWFFVAMFYGLFFASCKTDHYNKMDHYKNYCLTKRLPGDNTLPQYFANNILSGHPEKKYSSWNMYDRPPLQSAILMTNVSPFGTYTVNDYAYFVVAVLLQTAWVPILWLLLPELAALTDRQRYFVMGSLVFSGFFYLNSVFVWPKMLAGILTIGGYYYLLCRARSYRNSLYAGILTGLGFLSHGGMIFTVPAFLAVYVARGPAKDTLKRLADLAVFAAGFVVLYTPWGLYKAATATLGDRLIRWQIGGVETIDKRGTVQTIADSYQNTPLHQLIANRLTNLRTLFYYKAISFSNFSGLLDNIRSQTFFSTFFAAGIYNAGWLFFLKPFVSSENKKEKKALTNMALVVVIGLAFWVLTMFLPESTVIHQGSYATMMLLLILLAAKFAKHLAAAWLYVILSFQALFLLAVWGFNFYAEPGYHMSTVSAMLAWLLAGLLLIMFARGISKGSKAKR